jgi:hypothetical protein
LFLTWFCAFLLTCDYLSGSRLEEMVTRIMFAREGEFLDEGDNAVPALA